MGINYPLLFVLLKAGAHEKHVRVSTSELSQMLGVSQQTASRWLIQSQKEGLLERDACGIRLTHKSSAELRVLGELILTSLGKKKFLKLKGELISGMKDGRYYVPLPEYKAQFRQKLGITPYPGTFNLRIQDMEAKLILADRKGVTVHGFFHQGRFLGDIKCFPCVIEKKVKGFAILPSRSHYGLDVIEIISKANLRKALRFKDGDVVEFQISLE
jgi:riboflavin kinase